MDSRSGYRLPCLLVFGEGVFSGRWWYGNFETGYTGNRFVNDGNTGQGANKSAAFNFGAIAGGSYNVAIWYPADARNATDVPVDILTVSGTVTVLVNEQAGGGGWLNLGNYTLGNSATVTIRDLAANGLVVADAVQLTPTPSIVSSVFVAGAAVPALRAGDITVSLLQGSDGSVLQS